MVAGHNAFDGSPFCCVPLLFICVGLFGSDVMLNYSHPIMCANVIMFGKDVMIVPIMISSDILSSD